MNTNLKTLVAAFLLCNSIGLSQTNSIKESILSAWTFEDVDDNRIEDTVNEFKDQVYGKYSLVKGVKGNGMKFDGFRTYVYREENAPGISGEFTVETWVALGVYPWYWGPVAEFRNADFEGFMFGINNTGNLGVRVPAGDSWLSYLSGQKLPLDTWIHIAAVVDEANRLSFYVNGEQTDSFKLKNKLSTPDEAPMYIGRNYTQEPWTEDKKQSELGFVRVLGMQTITGVHAFFDGIIDELKIHNKVLSSGEVQKIYKDSRPNHKPNLPERKFPQVHLDTGNFGAFYTKLNYYDEWDALWRVSDIPDVIIRFDNMPGKLVFWRGTSFVPCWVTENGIWYTNEWLETWGADVRSCAEPLMDRQCRFSHVRIIENHEARTVVHWRYALVDAYYTPVAVNDDMRGEWCDEFYIIYPDHSGIRKMELHYSKPMRPHDWSEQIVVLPPGTHPKEVINSPEVTLVNMQGEKHSYAWHDDLQVVFDEPKDANIQTINLKSKYRPFLILPPDPFESRDFPDDDDPYLKAKITKYESPFFRSYNAAMGKAYRPDPVPSVYGWWNHWPIAQVPGDGRWVLNADRASHINLTTFLQWKDHKFTDRTVTRIMLQGLTEKEPEELVVLAKSWLQAPEASILKGEFSNIEYDQAEKAFVIQTKNNGSPTPLQIELNASKENPLENPAFIIKQWGKSGAAVYMNDKPVPKEKLRTGHASTLKGVNLVIWLEMESTSPVKFSIEPSD